MLITKIPEERTFDFALRHVSGQADTLLISCCGLHSLSLPAALEKNRYSGSYKQPMRRMGGRKILRSSRPEGTGTRQFV